MKHLITTALFVTACIVGVARDYEPSEGWPYTYYDFKEAIVYYSNDEAKGRINIHLANNELHFTDGDKIKAAENIHDIDSVVCADGEKLIRRGNLFVRILTTTDHVVIGSTQECDFNELTDNNGAYGTSTVTGSAQNFATFNQFGNVAAYRYKDMIADRRNTRSLPTIDRTVMVINDRVIIHATKHNVNELLTKSQRKEFNKYLKEKKVKWKSIEGLILVARYLDNLIDNQQLGI